jgi:hypothetical protein
MGGLHRKHHLGGLERLKRFGSQDISGGEGTATGDLQMGRE